LTIQLSEISYPKTGPLSIKNPFYRRFHPFSPFSPSSTYRFTVRRSTPATRAAAP
jgi:hypothetical protein